MARWRKKPIVIEAEQYVEGEGYVRVPAGVCALVNGCSKGLKEEDIYFPHIHTLEGIHEVTNLDWIITGVKGEVYPCKPDIFEAIYEPA